jgi:GNAT superfamily N-acetyltransferase
VIVTTPDGAVVASADLLNRRHVRVSVYGFVHPAFRARGLGGYLVAWGESWTRRHLHQAPSDAQVVVDHYVRLSNSAACSLLEGRRYAPVRTVYVMAIDLTGPQPPARWPEGIVARPFRPGQDENALVEAGEDAFRDMRYRPPGTYDSWIGPTRSPEFDPALWILAEDIRSGAIAGFCLSRALPGCVWINSLGVRPAWRKRGLGLLLLRQAFAGCAGRGMRHVELSVDSESPTGAPRLYTRAGMHPSETYTVYGKELRPGRDYSTFTGSSE